MKVLVTGGAGYIGSHTVVELVKAGYQPVVVDDFSNSNRSVMKRLEKLLGQKIPLYEQDYADTQALRKIIKSENITGIIHFAAFKQVGESVREPLKYYMNNVSGLVSLLQLVKNVGIKHFVFSSSCTVYGEPDKLPVIEDAPFQPPVSPYGATKQMGEMVVRDTTVVSRSLNAIALRYFNPIGAHPSAMIGELPIGVPENLVPFITQTAAGLRKHLVVYGNDYPTPDFDADPRIRKGLRALKASEQREKIGSITSAKRVIGEHDALRLGHIVSESLERLDKRDSAKLTVLKVLGASLVTPHEAEVAYTKAYSLGMDPKLLKRFNRTVQRSIETVNRSRPVIFASLGEICIFGAPEISPGKRFIGPVIEEGSQDLDEERQVFFRPLIPGDNTALRNRFNSRHVNHLSLLSTTSERSAQQVAASLSMEGIEGMWVSLMHAQANSKDIILEGLSQLA